METNIRNKIIEDYKSGLSSLKIAKNLGLSMPTILKVLNKENLVRKRDRCSSIEINKNDDHFFVDRTCPTCKNIIQTKSKTKDIACRNHFNKLKGTSLCKKCSLKLQVGEGNPFYGKKHTMDSLEKMTKTLTENPRKFSSSSKPESKIYKILKDLGFNVTKTYKVKNYICDIFVKELNLIIEYNGDYWHCNPSKYDKNYIHPHKKKTAETIWLEDKVRVDNLKSYGYNLEVIWESEYDKELTIKKIISKYDKNKTFSNPL